jgi:hypothetical protein
MHTTFWPENLKGRNYLEELGIDGKIILYLIMSHLRTSVGVSHNTVLDWRMESE